MIYKILSQSCLCCDTAPEGCTGGYKASTWDLFSNILPSLVLTALGSLQLFLMPLSLPYPLLLRILSFWGLWSSLKSPRETRKQAKSWKNSLLSTYNTHTLPIYMHVHVHRESTRGICLFNTLLLLSWLLTQHETEEKRTMSRDFRNNVGDGMKRRVWGIMIY